jgi:hypothetical protein
LQLIKIAPESKIRTNIETGPSNGSVSFPQGNYKKKLRINKKEQ